MLSDLRRDVNIQDLCNKASYTASNRNRNLRIVFSKSKVEVFF